MHTLLSASGPSLYIISKLLLVMGPLFILLFYNTLLQRMGVMTPSGKIDLTQDYAKSLVVFGEKFLAHSAFYIGMGLPIIGLDSLLDHYRLLGFVTVNMLVHEYISPRWSGNSLKRFFPEWKKTLGLNFIIDQSILELNILIDQHKNILVKESPHSIAKKIIKHVEMTQHKGRSETIVEIQERFAPAGKSPCFTLSVMHEKLSTIDCGQTPGKCIKLDLGDLAEYARPLYINEYGHQNFLWRPQYWTKFFNEIAGKSYLSSPFDMLKKSILVLVGTPVAFIFGNVLTEFMHSYVLNLHPFIYFNYGLILAFTVGGMYGSAIGSTLIELFYNLAYRMKRLSNPDLPAFGLDEFGSLGEKKLASYRWFRLMVGGILAGGIGAWALSQNQGDAWNEQITALFSSPQPADPSGASFTPPHAYANLQLATDDVGKPLLPDNSAKPAVQTTPEAALPPLNNQPGNNTRPLQDEIIYFVMVDRFSDGSPENNIPLWAFPGDSEYAKNNRYWLPKMYYQDALESNNTASIQSYWGGDLRGVIQKMDYLNELGITTLLLSPVFENVNGIAYGFGETAYHGYWTKDFYRLEEHFVDPPTEGQSPAQLLSEGAIFKELIDKAHSYDPPIKVILDIALNHTNPALIGGIIPPGYDPKKFNLENGVLYRDGELVEQACQPTAELNCEQTYSQSGLFHSPPTPIDWGDESTWQSGIPYNLADLDQTNPQTKDYLWGAVEKWLGFGVDGFRIDAAKNIYPEYLVELEQKLLEKKPDIFLILEYYDGGVFEKGFKPGVVPPSVELLEDMPDSAMFDFSFATAARDYFSDKMDSLGTPYVLENVLDEQAEYNLLGHRSADLVNFINNHDIPRFLSLKGSSLARYVAAIKLLFLSRGAPTLLYGDEIALAITADSPHWQDSNNRLKDAEWSRIMMEWNHTNMAPYSSMLDISKKLIALRKQHPFLSTGESRFLQAENLTHALQGTSYLAMERTAKDRSAYAYYFYSKTARDVLTFKVNLPDGEYTDPITDKKVTVKEGVLHWTEPQQDEVLVLTAG
jgi:glycosidase